MCVLQRLTLACARLHCSQVWLPEVADGNEVVLKTKVRCLLSDAVA